jgi:putative FmdB family regulatory protein
MPTYDYRCPNGHDFEHFFRKISDAVGELACPVCGATAERRVSGGAGLVFKGSGFYLTDYGKNAHRTSGSASPSNDSKSESKGGESKSTGSSSGGKADSGSSTSSKSESGSGGGDGGSAKSDTAKSADTKTSSKPKGNDTK